jgi:poly-beta-hydroxyalkanoate depolymerase
MLSLLAQADRLFFETAPSKMQMILVIILPLALGYGVYFYFDRREPSDPLYKARWAGFLPLAVAVVLGILNVRNMSDYIYQQANLVGQNMKVMHYASLIVPILGAIGLFILAKRREANTRYDF